MDSNHRYPRERNLLLPRSELAPRSRLAAGTGCRLQRAKVSAYSNVSNGAEREQSLMIVGARVSAQRRIVTTGGVFMSQSPPNNTLPGMPIVPCPNKILLSNATSTLSINKSGTPVRGLRSKSRPFVKAGKLTIPIFFRDRFLPMSHLVSSLAFSSAPLGSFSGKTILRGDR